MIFLEMFVAFAATMAFAVIFNVSRSELIFCGIAGLVAEGVYLFTLRISDETALAIFVASIAVTVLSRILANVRRMPVTVYLIYRLYPVRVCITLFITSYRRTI